MLDATFILAECVKLQSAAGLALLGTDQAVRVRFEGHDRGTVTLQPLGPPPARISTIACVSFRYRRWAASFLSHITHVHASQITVATPSEVQMIDYRRSRRVRPAPATTAELHFIGQSVTVSVLDISADGIGATVPLGAPVPTLGSKVVVHIGEIEVPGVVVRLSGPICGIAFRPDTKQDLAIRLLLQEWTST